jgi:hypothetical protein
LNTTRTLSVLYELTERDLLVWHRVVL